MMMKKLVAIILVVCLVLSAFAGCAPKEDKVKLKVMIQNEDPNRQAIYQDYYKANVKEAFPDYEIEFEVPGSGKNYDSKLAIYNASETLPDVFWGAELVYNSKQVMPLTDKIKADGFYDEYSNKAGLIPCADGEIYSLQPGTDAFFACPILFNKEMFEENGWKEPTNWDEFLQLVKDIRAKGIVPISIVQFAYDFFLISDLMAIEDPDAMGKLQRGEIDVTDDLYVNAVKKLEQLVEAGAFVEDLVGYGQQEHEELYKSEKAAMIYHGSWIWGAVGDDKVDFTNSVALLPEWFGAKNVVNAWGNSYNGFMVSKNTKHPDAAVEVAEWLVKQDAKYWNEVQGNVTSMKGHDSLPADANTCVKYLYEKMTNKDTVVFPCYTLNFLTSAQNSNYTTELDKVIAGQIDADAFAKALKEIQAK